MDDESYFTLDHISIKGYNYFYTSDIEKTPDNVKYSPKAKFGQNLFVWISISERGITKPYFLSFGMEIDQKIYFNECIIKKLVPFIAKHHAYDKYLL